MAGGLKSPSKEFVIWFFYWLRALLGTPKWLSSSVWRLTLYAAELFLLILTSIRSLMHKCSPFSSSFFIFNFEMLKSSSLIFEFEKFDCASSFITLCMHFSFSGQNAYLKSFLYSVQKSFCSLRCMMLMALFNIISEF